MNPSQSEPIHTPGSIQPHGVLFVLEEPSLTILRLSANTETFLGVSPEALLLTKLTELVNRKQPVSLTPRNLNPIGRPAFKITHHHNPNQWQNSRVAGDFSSLAKVAHY
jgi:light-regulated signal transduction histidine kinase (bacteriophytochrome)